MADIRRDRWGRYFVLPPDGDKPVGYTRATTVAKALDDGGGLIPWKATATVVGTMRRPGLHARWQALINEHPDPWYGSEHSKAACKQLVEECSEAGGSSDRADVGTALHAIVEQSWKNPGGATPILTPAMQADVDAYHRAIVSAGIVVDPAYVEAVVVLDEHKVAGTSDNLSLFVPGYGNLVGDLKTGTDLKYSWQAIAIQLATYAHADNIYVQGPAADGSQDRRVPMPELNREVGLVIHLPAGEGRCSLHLVDLVAGWEAFERSMWTRNWRGHKTLARVLPAAQQLALDDDFDSPSATSAGTASPVGVSDAGTGRTANAPVPAQPAPDDFDTPVVGTTSPTDSRPLAAAPDVTAPAPVSAPGAGAPSTEPPDFDDVVAPTTPTAVPPQAASDSDREPPPPGAPVALSPAEQHALTPVTPDEGGPADPATAATVETQYRTLAADGKAWIARFATEAIQHKVSFHAKEAKTVRRLEILRGLVDLSAADSLDDESIRCITAAVVGERAHFPAITLGHLIGSLDAVEGAWFARCCHEYVTATVGSTVTEAGRVVLHFTALAAHAA